MKKLFALALVVIIFGGFCASGQLIPRYIAVQTGPNDDDVVYYTDINEALTDSPNGSNIYIPAGSFTLNSSTIVNRKLHIYGTGHYPQNYGFPKTIIYGNLNLISGADSSVIMGIYFNDNIQFGTSSSNDSLCHVFISRCNVNCINFGNYASSPSSTDILITENVIRVTIYGYSTTNSLIEKNIFGGGISSVSSSIITNNIFLYSSSWFNNNLLNISDAIIQNNIFRGFNGYAIEGVANSSFQNNLFRTNITNWANNAQQNNILNVNPDSIFVNQNAAIFNYNHDYHLLDYSPAKNAGTDGTDLGIYGTMIPYKELAIPENPRILNFIINAQGNTLQLNSSAEAQQR